MASDTKPPPPPDPILPPGNPYPPPPPPPGAAPEEPDDDDAGERERRTPIPPARTRMRPPSPSRPPEDELPLVILDQRARCLTPSRTRSALCGVSSLSALEIVGK